MEREFSNAAGVLHAMDYGANVISWKPNDTSEVFFCSSRTGDAVAERDEAHVGVPLCLPWFGGGIDGVEHPRAHGLVRWVEWDFIGAERLADDLTRVTWNLDQSAVTDLPGAADYPDDLQYRCDVEFGGRLRIAVTVTSPTREVLVDEVMHAYYAVSDVRQVLIRGLEGSETRDYVQGSDGKAWRVEDGSLRYRPRDEIHFGVGQIFLDAGGRTLTITPENAIDAVVWNPGPEGVGEHKFLEPSEWQRFVCIEIGNVQRDAVRIPAGATHTFGFKLSVS
ncbi:MAG: hypothetical protein SOS98_00240 [Varibaculum sp.]|nr:hypothetical protein [Varibaculum sp.]